jgi:hypothetical protein
VNAGYQGTRKHVRDGPAGFSRMTPLTARSRQGGSIEAAHGFIRKLDKENERQDCL